MTQRPERLRIIHELGKPQSLPSGMSCYDKLGGGQDLVFLGLGPDINDTRKLAKDHLTQHPQATVYFAECSDFISQMSESWRESIPKEWQPVSPSNITRSLFLNATTYIYQRSGRLFPTFWGPIIAQAQLACLRPTLPVNPQKTIILPGSNDELLIRELEAAFTKAGFTIRRIAHDKAHIELPKILANQTPTLFFSVNFLGLDAYGERANMLNAADCPVAVWCVDTPWHLLSGCKTPYWKNLHLFVTDNSFIHSLQKHGAQNVHHLPLAAAQEMIQAGDQSSQQQEREDEHKLQPLVFVGSSVFPKQEKFFAGLRPDQNLLATARTQLEQGQRPDYHWWSKQLDINEFWPNASARSIGCGADATSRAWRSRCLQVAADCGLTVFGDNAWKSLVTNLTDLRPPVDYYTTLPSIYRKGTVSLNITSLMLPAGLTQRHFDVWAAGGFLLSDATHGLDLFPVELTAPITFKKPQEIKPLTTRLLASYSEMLSIKQAWRECILASHQYTNRIKKVLEACKIL